MNNVSFLKQWGKKYGIGIIVGLLMSVGFLVMDADRWIGMHTLNQKTAKYTVVIDSGHGGVDPGKIGVDGVYEKDINLAIAKQLQKVLERNDCQVIMTREADQGLYEESDTNKKRADMAKRVSIMNGCDADVVVSIHQNSYTDATSRGAQVFYQATSESGKQLATKIQETLKRDVAPDNRRQIKANEKYNEHNGNCGMWFFVESAGSKAVTGSRVSEKGCTGNWNGGIVLFRGIWGN